MMKILIFKVVVTPLKMPIFQTKTKKYQQAFSQRENKANFKLIFSYEGSRFDKLHSLPKQFKNRPKFSFLLFHTKNLPIHLFY